MENMLKTRNIVFRQYFSKSSLWLCVCVCVWGGGGMNPEEYDSGCKFKTTQRIGNYRGNNLAYGMLCDPII